MSDLQHVLSKINQIAVSYAPEKYALDVRILMRNFHEQFDAQQEGEDVRQRVRSEIGIGLCAIARRTQDLQLLITVTEQLFALPPAGPLHTLSLFVGDTLQDSVQTALLESFNPLHQLMMVNLGLSCSGTMSAPFVVWLKGQLPLLKIRLDKHASSFVEVICSQESALAFPVRTTLNRSKLVAGLRTQIDRKWNTGSIGHLLKLIRLLRLPSFLEYLSPALHTASDQRARDLFLALRDTPGPYGEHFTAELGNLVRNAGLDLLPHALQALIAIAPGPALEVMLTRYENQPDARLFLARMLTLLDARAFETMYRAVPPPLREGFCSELLDFILQVDPGGLRSLIKAPWIRTEPELLSLPDLLWPMLSTQTARLISKVREPGREPGPADAPVKRTVEEELREGALLSGAELHNAQFDNCRYSECEFEHLRASETRWMDSSFERCSFTGCLFETSSFTRVSFRDCSFTDCRMDHSLFQEVSFNSGRMTRCLLSDAGIDRSRIESMIVSGCGFHRASITNVEILSSTVTDCDFGQALFTDAVVRGSDFRSCSFASAVMQGCDLHGMTLCSCSFLELTLYNTSTLEPALLLRQLQCFLDAVLERSTAPESREPLPDLSPHQVLQLVQLWFDSRSMRSQEERFLVNNARRMRLARDRLSDGQRRFFDLVPILLTMALPWEEPIPEFSWSISGYVPSPDELSRAGVLLGAPLRGMNRPMQRIEGVYTIGSTGSFAQTEHSDLDYWICADLSTWSAGAAQALRTRVSGLCLWAREHLDADVHFFLQDFRRILENDFDPVDRESSGTAQGLLLKEEFYRTGLRVAGLPPLWWMLPSGSSSDEYERVMESGQMLGLEFTDFGYLSHIPSSEFFGASLWQIVKSFQSPFKSILKFGLLETYVRRIKRPLLCELLKEGVLSGTENPLHVDPYVLLFREVWNYFCMAVDKNALEILKFSFLQKTGMDLEQLEELFGDELKGLYCLEDLFGRETGFSGSFEQLDFKRLLEVEESLNRFMVRTYVRIQESLSQKGGKVAIDSSDLNRLGRKIFTVFAPRTDKIERLPYILTRRSMFEEFSFSSGQNDAGEREWFVRGKQIDAVTNRSYLSELNSSGDLVGQLLWLVANKLYHPDIQIRTDFTVSPVTRDDLAQLLAALRTALPPDSLFDTDISEGLRPERVLRSLLVLNMTLPRATEHVVEASICYATNWGELFCRSFPVGRYKIPLLPKRFISHNLKKELDPSCAIGIFTPPGAACLQHVAPSGNQPVRYGHQGRSPWTMDE
jgi:adenylate cyclase, class 1